MKKEEFLRRLQATTSDDERNWLITKNLLDTLPDAIRQMIWAAAVPHWFDTEILAALRPELAEKVEELYTQLQSLPFVEPFAGRGYNIHELTRRLMLNWQWQECHEEYVELSRRATYYFNNLIRLTDQQSKAQWDTLTQQEPDEDQRRKKMETWIEQNISQLKGLDPQIRIEQIYHLLEADPEQGADALCDQALQWHDSPNYAYELVGTLARAAGEQANAGRLQGRGRGWGRFFEGLIASYQYQYLEAKIAFQDVLTREYQDNQLEANCIKALGDVNVQLSELPEARTRYEEALPIYRTIGDKLGEANCIQALGDVNVQLSELPEARTRYEEALPIYRTIGAKLGEANCIQALGDVNVRLSELPEARTRYEEALPIYRTIGAKLGEANCIQALGDVNVQLSELPEARTRYEEALPIYRTIGDKLGEANCIQALGELAVEEENFSEAFTLLEDVRDRYQALTLPAQEAGAINSIAGIYDKQKNRMKAIEAYTQALAVFPSQAGYILRNRANQYLKLKDAVNATIDIEASASIQPDHAYLFLRRGELAILQGRYEQAIAHFQESLKRYPRLNSAYFGIGLANLYNGKPVEALKAYHDGLAVTDARKELDDFLEILETLRSEQPSLVGVEDAIDLLRKWQPA